jgi:hypothetical protein
MLSGYRFPYGRFHVHHGRGVPAVANVGLARSAFYQTCTSGDGSIIALRASA